MSSYHHFIAQPIKCQECKEEKPKSCFALKAKTIKGIKTKTLSKLCIGCNPSKHAKFKICLDCNISKNMTDYSKVGGTGKRQDVCRKCVNSKKKVAPTGHKVCSSCNEIKSLSEFHTQNDNKSASGVHSACKDCINSRTIGKHKKDTKTKECLKCHMVKPLPSFRRSIKGLADHCRKCAPGNKVYLECTECLEPKGLDRFTSSKVHTKICLDCRPAFFKRYIEWAKETATHKKCAMCKEDKLMNDFSPGIDHFGRSSYCHECHYFEKVVFYNYGITREDYQAILVKQNYKCDICKKVPRLFSHHREVTGGFVVDHNHACPCSIEENKGKTCGKCIRRLLCNTCNTGLGAFQDDISSLLNAGLYVFEHGGELNISPELKEKVLVMLST